MRICPLTQADLPALLEIENEGNPEPWTADSFLVEFNRVQTRLLGCRDSGCPGDLLGYICYWIVADELEVLNLGVRASHRRLGIGRRLLDRALKEGRECGLRKAFLDVREGNEPARNLYTAAGFRTAGKRPGYYQGTRESAIIMKLDLTPPLPSRRRRQPPPARGRGPHTMLFEDP